MGLLTGIAVYLVLWWIAFLIVLPIGNQSQYEAGEHVKGTESGAPVKPRLLKKIILASCFSLILFILFYFIVTYRLIEWTDFPFFDETESY